jgi:hypothetical protein
LFRQKPVVLELLVAYILDFGHCCLLVEVLALLLL